ncbi:MAG: hypothetical protein CSA45_06450 [Gammaproteobacteria bacterium]|nr:MAG: hypothetical protein CSA45_06450 [Gammaproteobacteria bacterium]
MLEQVRLLTNLETDSQKLLRIILVGQEELQDIINRSDLRQLSQRITGRYHLTALNAKEVNEYIAHRIKTAKGNPSIFTSKAMKHVYCRSGGVPRLINVLCDRALLVAYNADAYRVTCKHIKIAAAETMPVNNQHRTVAGLPYLSPAATWALLPLGIITLLGVAYGGYHYLQALSTPNATTPVTVATTANQPIPKTATEPTISSSGTIKKPQTTRVEVSRETSASDKTTRPSSEAVITTTTVVTAKPNTVTATTNHPEASPVASTTTLATPTSTIIDKIAPTLSTSEIATISPVPASLQKIPNPNAEQTPLATTISTTSQPKRLSADLNAMTLSSEPSSPKTVISTTTTTTPSAVSAQPVAEQGVSQTEGVRILLKRWGIDNGIPAQQTACEFVESQNMQCLIARGGLPLIRTINRPVLLELKNNNKSSWLPIIGIDSTQQLICLKNTIPQVCDTPNITRYWSGVLLVLLRQPSVSVQIRPGFEGEQIHWLRQRLAIAEKRDLDSISIVGNETLLYLYNVVADEQTPLLFAEDY